MVRANIPLVLTSFLKDNIHLTNSNKLNKPQLLTPMEKTEQASTKAGNAHHLKLTSPQINFPSEILKKDSTFPLELERSDKIDSGISAIFDSKDLNTLVRRRMTAFNSGKRSANDIKSVYFLKEPEFGNVRDLRRNSYGGRSSWEEADTTVEDGFLTTTLCSTEL